MKLFPDYTALFLIIAIAVSTISCNSSTNTDGGEPPQLPPSESLEMNFSFFTSSDIQPNAGTALTGMDTPYSNFLQASSRVLILNGAATTNLALPVAVLAGAEAVEPEINGDGDWEWNYSVSGPNQQFSVRITAEQQASEQVSWNAYVSNSTLNLDSKLFFSGFSSSDNSFGGWTFYQLFGLNSGAALSELNWNIENISEATLELEILSNRLNRFGNVITLEKINSVKKTTYTDADESIITEIQWDTDTREGTLTTPDYNGGEQACWDSNFLNTEC